MAVLNPNPTFLEMSPTMSPIVILTSAKGMSTGLVVMPIMTFVKRPTTAPQSGPKSAAAKMVPMVSIKINGIFNIPTKVPKTILMTIQTVENIIILE